MTIQRRTIQDKNHGTVSATILTVVEGQVTSENKKQLEDQMIEYAEHVLFQGQGLNIYRHQYNDKASIVVVTDINAIDGDRIKTDEQKD